MRLTPLPSEREADRPVPGAARTLEVMATDELRFSARTPAPPRGRLLSSLANAMVRLYADAYGRGPTKAKTYWTDDVITILLEGGHAEHVHTTRRLFQEVKRAEFIGVVEELTGRSVKAFLSQANLDPNLAVEVFVLHPEGD